jgi:hypothetical protein
MLNPRNGIFVPSGESSRANASMTGGRVQQGQRMDSDPGTWVPPGWAERDALSPRRGQVHDFLEGVFS